MTRIATSQLSSSNLAGLEAAQLRQATAGQQLNSGRLASDLKGYAANAVTLTATQAVSARIDSYVATNGRLADRLSDQDNALTSVSSAADGVQLAVTKAVANGDGSTLIQQLQGWFSQASQALNVQSAGAYLFAGGNSTAPVDTSDVTTLDDTANAQDHFQNGPLVKSDRLDETTTLSTGFTASQVGGPLFDALRTIVAYDADPTTGPLGSKLTQAQSDFLQAQIAPLTQVAAGVRTFVAKNGENQSRVDASTAVLTDRKTAATGVLTGVTDVDPAQAATNVQLATVALQASAQVFQTLTGTTLLDLLRS